MALKSYKPITPSLRQLVIVDRTGLWKGKPVKALTRGKTNTGGRNNHGHITSNHMAGSHKRRLRRAQAQCLATGGPDSNADNQTTGRGKAGRQRWLGIRPTVRGVAMNPVDHPPGGGEGRTSGGRHPATPWGKPTKGKKTRKNKATDKYVIHRRGATR